MTDAEHATQIRDLISQLRVAVSTAETDGLTVVVSQDTAQFFQTGNNAGEPAWQIYRQL